MLDGQNYETSQESIRAIKMDPTVMPVVHEPRCQTKALSAKTRTNLKDCHLLMVMILWNGKLRICSDPKDLNKAIR